MNPLVDDFKGRLETIKAWRHHFHKHPELSLEEAGTAKYIVDLVGSWGYGWWTASASKRQRRAAPRMMFVPSNAWCRGSHLPGPQALNSAFVASSKTRRRSRAPATLRRESSAHTEATANTFRFPPPQCGRVVGAVLPHL